MVAILPTVGDEPMKEEARTFRFHQRNCPQYEWSKIPRQISSSWQLIATENILRFIILLLLMNSLRFFAWNRLWQAVTNGMSDKFLFPGLRLKLENSSNGYVMYIPQF